MHHMRLLPTLSLALAAAVTTAARAGDQTVGLFINEPEAQPGYTLFSPLNYETTYLIDISGQLVNSWSSSYDPGNSYYLRPNGNLLRAADPGGNPVFFAGGDAGLVEEYDWDGALVWSFLYSNSEVRAHHDIEPMPNGNVLILAWEHRSAAEAIAAGRDPSQISQGQLWPEHIIEVQPDGPDGGTIVWEWHVWDHLVQDFDPAQDNFGVVADHPELIDINFMQAANADWMHANAVDYNPQLDQILINSPFLGEFWIIDHSTTTEEAAGHTGGRCGRGGDILYRWGNPQAYDAGTDADRKFYNQHDARWIDAGLPGAGNFMVFNNGAGRPEGPFTTIEEIAPPVAGDGCYEHVPGTAYGPDEPLWIYTADPPTDFYSSFISGATRQPNGNTLICSGAWGEIFEVTPDAEPETVWFYLSPVTSSGPVMQGARIPQQGNSTTNRMFRAKRYPPDFAGFVGKDLTPQGPIEIYPPSCSGDITGGPGGGPDGVVDVADLIVVILNWGTSGHGAEIADPADVVDVNDLVAVILAWGPCRP